MWLDRGAYVAQMNQPLRPRARRSSERKRLAAGRLFVIALGVGYFLLFLAPQQTAPLAQKVAPQPIEPRPELHATADTIDAIETLPLTQECNQQDWKSDFCTQWAVGAMRVQQGEWLKSQRQP